MCMKRLLKVMALGIVSVVIGSFIAYLLNVHTAKNGVSGIDIQVGWTHPKEPGTRTCTFLPQDRGVPFLTHKHTPVDSCLLANNGIAEYLNIGVVVLPLFIAGLFALGLTKKEL